MLTGPSGFDEALHPRAQGGKFGVANNPKQQPKSSQASKLKAQLHDRARQYRQQAHNLKLRLASIEGQIASLRSTGPKSHSTAKKSTTTAKTKGTKHGTTTKKMPKGKSTTAKAGKPSLSANQQQIQKLSGQAGTMRLQIKMLEQRASQLDSQARKL